MTEEIVKVCGIEVDGEFALAIKQAVTMNHLPYTISIHKSKQREAERWCSDHLGKRWSVVDNRQGVWCCFWAGTRTEHPGYYDFHFLNERDMCWVALRWA